MSSSSSKVLTNGSNVLSTLSKVVQTRNGLLEIRRGQMTFSRSNPVKPHLWASEREWAATLHTWDFPVPPQVVPERPAFLEPQPPQTPKKVQRGTAYVEGLPSGSILSNMDETSKVLILRNRTLYELRRGKLTFRGMESACRRTWTSLSNWKEFLEEVRMNSDLKVFMHKDPNPIFDQTGFPVSSNSSNAPDAPPAPKKVRTNSFQPASEVYPLPLPALSAPQTYLPLQPPPPIRLPSPYTQPQLALTPIEEKQKARNLLVEQVRQRIATDLRKEIDNCVLNWAQKLKIE